MKKLIKKFKAMPLIKRVQMCVAALVTIIALAAIPVVAWFAHEKELATLTKVNAPSNLYINAAHKEDVVNIDLSNINVEEKDSNGDPVTSQRYVFCVRGDHVATYDLQIAHTTNIPFTYTLYKASEAGSGDTVYATYPSKKDNTNYDYKNDGALPGRYLNNANDGTGNPRVIADNTYKSRSYGDGDSVQKYANAAYWQANTITTTLVDSEFCDYYILEITWSQNENAWNYVKNDKETDMIYITAEVHRS